MEGQWILLFTCESAGVGWRGAEFSLFLFILGFNPLLLLILTGPFILKPPHKSLKFFLRFRAFLEQLLCDTHQGYTGEKNDFLPTGVIVLGGTEEESRPTCVTANTAQQGTGESQANSVSRSFPGEAASGLVQGQIDTARRMTGEGVFPAEGREPEGTSGSSR